MFTLFFDRPHHVLMARVAGIFSSEDMAALDAAVVRFLSREDAAMAAVRALYDFRDVEAITMPATRIAERGRRPAIVRERRVMVAPRRSGETFGMSFRNHQSMGGNGDLVIVRALEDAYSLLDLAPPCFEPIQQI